MPISDVAINSLDVDRSVAFYRTFLDAEVVGDARSDVAVLDLVTATVTIRAIDASSPVSTFLPDDLQRGFRHVGFKVDRVDPYVERLKAAEVPFHLDPLNAEGGVRITFFYDPDGTLVELVEGDLQYHDVVDGEGVRQERALGVPDRPRFDHVAVTVDDRSATEAFYAQPYGFTLIGTIEQPHDPRGFSIGFLKSGPTVLEIFTYAADKTVRAPQIDAPGFAYVTLEGAEPDQPRTAGPSIANGPLSANGPLFTDADGFPFAVSEGRR